MIDKICEHLTAEIQREMPEIDSQRAEEINYGLQLLIGEIPKIILLFIVAFCFNIGTYAMLAYLTMLPYKIVAGGFHLKTNVGCTIGTMIIYFGNVFISKVLVFNPIYLKHIVTILVGIFSIIMISIYAPADTINLPILRKKERKIKKILSYVFAIVTLIISFVVKENTIANILLLNVFIESVCITRIAYKITKNEYGYENYLKQNKNS